ncbi:MAG: hypothetical protein ABIN80_18695 [Dyadobacter sp.]|uniref:hypothetical protein n=1 Tax=Dyadobacter sp. TaxID=1914288 RepID=UPI003262E739
MYLFVDHFQESEISFVSDLRKIRYNLSVFGILMEEILINVPEKVLPSSVFHAGRYIVVLQFERDITSARMHFVDYHLDILMSMHQFVRNMSPKMFKGIAKMQDLISQKSDVELAEFELSDDHQLFDALSHWR